eukprot:g19208.t1
MFTCQLVNICLILHRPKFGNKDLFAQSTAEDRFWTYHCRNLGSSILNCKPKFVVKISTQPINTVKLPASSCQSFRCPLRLLEMYEKPGHPVCKRCGSGFHSTAMEWQCPKYDGELPAWQPIWLRAMTNSEV